MYNRGGGGGGGRGGYGGGGGGRGGGGYGGGGRGGGGGGYGGGGGGGGRGGGGGFRGGARRGGNPGRQPKTPAEVWSLPPCPRDGQNLGELRPSDPPSTLPTEITSSFLQKPKEPGQVSMAKYDCIVNHFELELNSKFKGAHFYSVLISKIDERATPEGDIKVSKKERKLGLVTNRKVFSLLTKEQCHGQLLAYDGKQRALALVRLPNDSLNVTVTQEDGSKWDVYLAYEKFVTLNDLKRGPSYMKGETYEEELLTIAMILNHMPSNTCVPLGRGFYDVPGEETTSVGGALELKRGFKSHVLPGTDKVHLNINYAITPFLKEGHLRDLIPEMLNLRELPRTMNDRERMILRQKLQRCRVETTHLPKKRVFSVMNITERPATKITFTDNDGRNTTVSEHFRKHHGELRYPELPCVQIGREKSKYFPFEHLRVTKGNPFRGDQSPQLVRDIIEQAAIQPLNRLEEIRFMTESLRKMCDFEREFGLKIGNETVVPARIIPPPKLIASNNSSVQVNPGVIDFRQNSFYKGSSIQKWTMIGTDENLREDDLNRMAQIFMNQARKTGVNLGDPLKVNGRSFHFISDRKGNQEVEKQITEFVTQNKLQFVLFAISDNSNIHGSIKYVCDIQLGVSSKCMKTGTIRKVVNNDRPGPDQCVLNILYGLNPKFNGINVVAANTEFATRFLAKEDVLILGLDVNHGRARIRKGVPKMPSTVGVVGTRSKDTTLYTAFMRAQKKPAANSANREMIDEEILVPAVKAILKNFYKETGKKPNRIMIYRDGVSNGEFTIVLNKELKAIVKGCAELSASYRPKITFVVVQKTHDTRVFPKKVLKDNRGREKQNPIAGTVVEPTVTSPKTWNFFMVTHEGIQGTSRPAHYSVLMDENNFTSDQLQSLTYYLCHLYGKCPRSVSLPAPTYYAHHVAARAAEIGSHKYFASNRAFDAESTTSGASASSKSEAEILEDEEKIRKVYCESINTSENFAKTMFFL